MKELNQNREHRLIEKATLLEQIFVTRHDSFAVQNDKGYISVKAPLATDHIVKHLEGQITLGVYVLSEENKAKFAVIDADDEDGFNKLYRAWVRFPLPSYLETSRRGAHLWFFFEEPIEGNLAKNFGLEIAKRFSVEAEVFPKQGQSYGPGSCIRLPFGIHKKSGERYPFVGLGSWAAQLDTLAHAKKIPLEKVMQYQEPERKKPFYVGFTELNGGIPMWEKVKRMITVEELVSNYVELNDTGLGKCPFHEDNHPSFSVNLKENYWNCFSGCGGGSVIDFWMKLNNMEFKDAVKDLAERLGINGDARRSYLYSS